MSNYKYRNMTKVFSPDGFYLRTLFTRATMDDLGDISEIILDIHHEEDQTEADIIYAAYRLALLQLRNDSIENLEKLNPPKGSAEWKRLETAKLRRKVSQRASRVSEVAYWKNILPEEEFQQAAEHLGWDLEEFSKYNKPRPQPVKKDSERRREFLAGLFQDVNELSVEEVKAAAVKASICSISDNGKLEDWDALRMIAQREGYISESKGVWSDPLKRSGAFQ